MKPFASTHASWGVGSWLPVACVVSPNTHRCFVNFPLRTTQFTMLVMTDFTTNLARACNPRKATARRPTAHNRSDPCPRVVVVSQPDTVGLAAWLCVRGEATTTGCEDFNSHSSTMVAQTSSARPADLDRLGSVELGGSESSCFFPTELGKHARSLRRAKQNTARPMDATATASRTSHQFLN